MKCHYEVLGVARDASSSEIKTAYRKLALQWHPDKNLDQADEAKEQFQLIQQAYEVLSDHQERAWYDNHREQILRGKNSDYEDESLDLFQYFSVSCFKGFGDDSLGFYGVYREVFEKIRAEDAEFIEDEKDIKAIPMFGTSESSYEEVVGPFYAYWQSYCTKKSFAWLCPYNINEIKDRRILREIEKEMKKIVQKARKERNEEVRNLVAFIRKRDKRVQANKKLLEERAVINRMKQEQNRLEQIRRRQKALEEHLKSQADVNTDEYEEQLRQITQAYSDSEDDTSSDDLSEDSDEICESAEGVDLDEIDEDLYTDSLYCVACNRSFKNANARMNHETSKKHQDKVEKLIKEMHEEVRNPSNLEATKKSCDKIGENIEISEEISEEELLVSENKLKCKKNKKTRRSKVEVKVPSDEEGIPDILHDVLQDETDWSDEKKSKRGKQKRKNAVKLTDPENAQAISRASNRVVETLPANNFSETESIDVSHCCVTCKSIFQSKNKLFQHLKSTGHGVYLPKNGQPADITKKRGNRNK